MKPELVTIQKARLYQLGGAALFAVVLSFYAGYCSRGPGFADKKAQELLEKAVETSNEAGKIAQKAEPMTMNEVIPSSPLQAVPIAPPIEKSTPAKTPSKDARLADEPPRPKAAAPVKEAQSSKKTHPPAKPEQDKKEAKQAEPSAKTAAPAEKKEAKPSEARKFTIQVVSFKEQKEADKLVESLTKRNFPAYSRNVVIKGEKWHRVRVGSYPTADEAKKVAAKLESEKKFKAIIVKYE
jgi:septal ring-binding cell division protein DamX